MAEPTRHRFTVEDYHRMGRAGIFSEDDRVELIEGEVVDIAPMGSEHAACVDRLSDVLGRLLRSQVIVRMQNPIRLSAYSEPQPEVALVRRRPDYYRTGHPGPEDILLVVEVADTSVEQDRRKIVLYGRAGIPEAWLVDLTRATVEVYKCPAPRGYDDVLVLRRGQPLTLQAFPDLRLGTDDILG
jgi:Uma2 family endonuclease